MCIRGKGIDQSPRPHPRHWLSLCAPSTFFPFLLRQKRLLGSRLKRKEKKKTKLVPRACQSSCVVLLVASFARVAATRGKKLRGSSTCAITARLAEIRSNVESVGDVVQGCASAPRHIIMTTGSPQKDSPRMRRGTRLVPTCFVPPVTHRAEGARMGQTRGYAFVHNRPPAIGGVPPQASVATFPVSFKYKAFSLGCLLTTLSPLHLYIWLF